MSGYMTTFRGEKIDMDSPAPSSINLIDIAHHLSMLCHWCGASREFFSVAQHCVLVATICPPELARWGLLHDAAEAYLGDMIRPVKVRCPDYRVLEKRFLEVIADRFGLPWPEPPELKPFDNAALQLEADFLMPHDAVLHDGWGQVIQPVTPSDSAVAHAWSPREAEQHYLACAVKLGIPYYGLK